jgi:hypothetical protein
MYKSRFQKPTFSLKRCFSASHLLSLGLGSSLLFGCFDPSSSGGESSPEPITHEEAHQLIDSTVREAVESLDQRLRFLDGDQRLIEALNSLFPSDEGLIEECWIDYDAEGNEVEVCEEFSDEEAELDSGEERIEINFQEGASEMISDILEELPSELVIEGQSQLTYQLNINRLCEQSPEEEWEDEEEWIDDELPAPEGFQDPEDSEPSEAPMMEEVVGDPETEIDPDCLRIMEQESPRIRIQSHEDGFKADLLVAQGDERLVSAIVTSDLVKVSTDLSTVSRLVSAFESSDEEEGEANDSISLEMSGVVSLQMDMSAANRAVVSVNVDSPLNISGHVDGLEEINFSFPAAQNIFSLSSDSEAPALNLGVAIPKLVESLQASLTSEYEYDEETGEEYLIEEGPIREIVATLGGLNLNLNLKLVDEGVETAIEVGLGQESTSLQVDGQEIIKVDLNPDHGRMIAFDFDHSALNEENLMIALASELHSLKVDLKLGLVEEIGAPLGFADELYHIAFTSLAGELPALKLGGEMVAEVLSGELEISAERAGLSLNAEAGMCIDVEEEEEESFEEPSEEQSHPLEVFVVNACMVEGE